MRGDERTTDLDRQYHRDFAACYVRAWLPEASTADDGEAVHLGLKAGLPLYRFKRTAGLPRVRKVLGILRGLAPESLLDLGSGRGVFLWPLLEAFPGLSVLAGDRNGRRVADLQAVAAGVLDRLMPVQLDAHRLPLAGRSIDVVTCLEVLEHLADPPRALAEALRVARRFVVLSVPSRPDDNPEHIHLFTRESLGSLLRAAGAARVTFDGVLNHLIAVARV